MDETVEDVRSSATKAQEEIYRFLADYINRFEISDGRFVVGQSVTARIAFIQRRMEEIIGEIYRPSITAYLGHYSTIDDITVALHRSYNELAIEKYKLTPARRTVYDQAEYYLTNALADAYIQPAKYLLMQMTTTGITLKDAQSALRNWNDGELVSGKLTSGRQLHRLQAYSTQIARDSIFNYNGTIQNIIAKEYELTSFVYVGGVISDSRSFCRHLVALNRKIKLEEVPPLVEKYPDGLFPDTTKKNFFQVRGGYNCLHIAMPVKG